MPKNYKGIMEVELALLFPQCIETSNFSQNASVNFKLNL